MRTSSTNCLLRAGEGASATQRLAKLVRAVDDLAKGDGAGAYATLKTDEIGQPYRAAALLLRPWAAIAAGEGAPLDATYRESGRVDRLNAAFSQFNQALVLEGGSTHSLRRALEPAAR